MLGVSFAGCPFWRAWDFAQWLLLCTVCTSHRCSHWPTCFIDTKPMIHLIIAIVLICSLNRNYMKGLCLAVFFLVLLPKHMFVFSSQSLPDLSTHRLILIIVFIYWMRQKTIKKNLRAIPFCKCFLFLLVTNLITTSLSIDFPLSLTRYLSLLMEQFLFYCVCVTSLRTQKDVDDLLIYTCIALGLVGLGGFIEKYCGFNPAVYLPIDSVTDDPRVKFTYPHPILFGIAMTIGWPLCLVLIAKEEATWRRLLLWVLCFLMIGGVYFSMSRGVWLTSILVGILMLLMSHGAVRKRLIFIVVLAAVLTIARPGIFFTFRGLAEKTLNIDTQKGANFYYRLELWRKAYSEISKSSKRFLFGYGLSSHMVMDLQEKDGPAAQVSLFFARFHSWDNHYAAALIDTGFVGLLAFVLLYCSPTVVLFRRFCMVEEVHRHLVASAITSTFIIVFMMTNVYVFAPQLKTLFWINVSIGTYLLKTSAFIETDREPSDEVALLNG